MEPEDTVSIGNVKYHATRCLFFTYHISIQIKKGFAAGENRKFCSCMQQTFFDPLQRDVGMIQDFG